jgi:hypothetical protein
MKHLLRGGKLWKEGVVFPHPMGKSATGEFVVFAASCKVVEVLMLSAMALHVFAKMDTVLGRVGVSRPLAAKP